MKDTSKPLKIFIGWDSREDIAYEVCKQSILDNASVPVDIIPLRQKALIHKGLYSRPEDPLASTEFTFTRFLVPEFCRFKGWALFIDCDMLLKTDIKELFDQIDDKYAVMCVHHDYTPAIGLKMDGRQQTAYPRKNWSSMMLINCGHESNQTLTKELVNDETVTGAYLHRFSWLDNQEIGKIGHEWNWLVGWYNEPADGTPKLIHYTEGGPWFEDYQNCEYAIDWYRAEATYYRVSFDKVSKKAALAKFTTDRTPVGINQLTMPLHQKIIIDHYIKRSIDPKQQWYTSMDNKIQTEKTHKVATIFNDDLTYSNNFVYDEYLEAFAIGSLGRLSTYDEEQVTKIPLVIRGIGKGAREALHHCHKTSREYYYIDTGYWGNDKSKSKGWHRITKNNLQAHGPIIDRPSDRLDKIGYKYEKFRSGSKILICPPSKKVMVLWNQPDPEAWVRDVITELKKYTDRPIEIRMKPTRTVRTSTNTIVQALGDDVHCLITYNSIAATEALMNGKPAIALGPNAASIICNTELSEIENLNCPDSDLMQAFMRHLSYGQFTKKEMMDGTAWRIVNESSELPLFDTTK